MKREFSIRQSVSFDPFPGGARLRCLTEPAPAAVRGCVVLAPPFAEEMNKSRRMCARMARDLAADGWRVSRLDLYGSGDSAGEFGDATWSRWIDDLQREVRRQAEASPGPMWFWCLRAGALFAEAMLEIVPGANLLLWQPVTSGANHLQQFMRLQKAADLLGSGPDRGQEAPTRNTGARERIEVAGYELSPALTDGLREARFRLPPGRGGRVVWLELSVTGVASAVSASQRAVDVLRSEGREVHFETLPGPAFWLASQTTENEDLLERSRALLDTVADSPVEPANGPSFAPLVDDTSADGVREKTIEIPCEGALLPGIVAYRADAEARAIETAVVIVVGGPQYRVGSHRQFVRLSRALARDGLAVLRFDCRGMGDAEGAMRTFEETGADLAAAIDALTAAFPPIRRVILWGLCDAASLILVEGTRHRAVAAVALANPWVRDDASIAAVTVKHYYGRRLLEGAFWRKALGGRIDWKASARSLGSNLARAFAVRRHAPATPSGFRSRMAKGLAAFDGPVLLLLSGNDLTAREFVEHAGSAPAWRGLLCAPRVSRVDLAEADHTFSRRRWKDAVEAETRAWLRRLH